MDLCNIFSKSFFYNVCLLLNKITKKILPRGDSLIEHDPYVALAPNCLSIRKISGYMQLQMENFHIYGIMCRLCGGESACFTQQNHGDFRDMTIFYNMSLQRENIILTETEMQKITYFIQIKSRSCPINSFFL